MQNLKKFYESLALVLKNNLKVKVYIDDINELKTDAFLIKLINYSSINHPDGMKEISIHTDLIYYLKEKDSLKLLEMQEKINNILATGIFVEERFYKFENIEFNITDGILHSIFNVDITFIDSEYDYKNDKNNELAENTRLDYMKNLIVRKE